MSGKITAIVLAAGKGSRMRSDIQKQFMLLGEYPVVYYSLKMFEESRVDNIILVTGEQDIEYCRHHIVEKYGFSKINHIVAGGKERYESVYNALKVITESDYVMIHDGARPFITDKMIEESIEAVKRFDACTVGMPVKDTIKLIDDECFGIETPDRRYVYQIQTPQTFRKELLSDCYNKLERDKNIAVTDDTMVVERYSGRKSKVLVGSYTNIKITTPEDIKIAEIFLKNMLT